MGRWEGGKVVLQVLDVDGCRWMWMDADVKVTFGLNIEVHPHYLMNLF